MSILHKLSNLVARKSKKRVGRGPSSKVGKTCGRGEKGDKSRSGYKRRYGKIGGAIPLHMKTPIRGFSRARFKKPVFILNLYQIEEMFRDNEEVCIETLKEKEIISQKFFPKLTILSTGEITKKISIKAHSFSKQARKKLEDNSIPYKII